MPNRSLYEPQTIRALFDEMSATYGLMNLITSFGFAARWRHQVVENLPLAEAGRIVDLMSGMNELCHCVSKRVSANVRMTGIDISPEMVRRARKDWPFHAEVLLEDVLAWQYQRASADVIISSFGLKTFNLEQQEELARLVSLLLKPGGAFSFVEISVPPSRFLRWPYMFYLHVIIPLLGRLFLGNPANYRLLGIFTQAFGNCRHFAQCLRQQGLEVHETSHFFGCATGVRGKRPRTESAP